ncbi:Cof-type HAD-IIB family hydrolase [Levilactobacillus bambusae]|uniref:Cof-type HAD-IIB family hydrolase n=1 Tax=Levilactobacillus bambusae TaxID=2024736 RepID=A0A2V1MWP3_9LACO|nr:Cof-type HAD-IIB family hydrolase [Levilactobacillus bambusae]PWF99503.1 Cof-type HAD-IIB family hydrolase [Levilactobacillus bambusae]
MTYKALAFFDLDSTLLNADSLVDDEVATAMRQLKSNDVLPVIATGRNIFEIKEIMAVTGINSVVGGNGAFVEIDGHPAFSSPLAPGLIDLFQKFVNEQGDTFTMLNDVEGRADHLTKTLVDAYNFVNMLVVLPDPDFWKTNPVYMMVVQTLPEHDDLYRQHFESTHELTFYRNTPSSMDIVNYGVSKQTGIQELIKAGHFEGIPTYAFGDGNNDIPMLDFVDHAVAMGNALPHVVPHAEYQTTANTNHGIVNGLRHFDLIP